MASSAPSNKWLPLAEQKFKRGYILVIHDQRRIANFFKPGKGYEPCPYRIARDMIAQGFIATTGKCRPLGLEYGRITATTPRPVPLVHDEEDEITLSVSSESLIETVDDLDLLEEEELEQS